MSIKLILLQSGDQVIADAREVISEEKVVAYLFKKPHKVSINKPFLVSESTSDSEGKVQITLSPWILLSADEEIAVPTNYVVTIVDPMESLKEMYFSKTHESTSSPIISEEEMNKLRGKIDLNNLDLQKLAEIYSLEELEALKEMYLGKNNGSNS